MQTVAAKKALKSDSSFFTGQSLSKVIPNNYLEF
jgi:hypothetical protein